jgi:hypothetical protein
MRRRAIVYAVLALAVPLPALALTGQGGPAEPAGETSLSVSASLDTCGTAADTIVCKIDATWNEVAGADRYTATVTRADGSVVDFGDVGAGGSSFWVPYVGNGTYTVTVSAYGTPPGEENARVVARASAKAGSKAGPGPGAPAPDAPGPAGGDVAAGDASEAPAPGPTEPEPEEPTCEVPSEPPAPEEPPATEDPVAPGDGVDGEPSALSAEAESALSDSAELPESVACPDAGPDQAEAAGATPG